MKKILCYGHYNHQNIGDELFKVAFKKLFPEYDFTFTDHLTLELLKNKDALFFGGGSFLNQHIEGFDSFEFMPILDKMKIFYIGVGLETEIHLDHWMLLTKAKLIASRSEDGIDQIRLNVYKKQFNIDYVPDLVYYQSEAEIKSLKFAEKFRYKNSVLILPNISVLPTYDSPSWITSAWENYKNQFAQFCDWLIDNDYKINFYAMCQNATQHDNFAATQIISMMKNRDYNLFGYDDKNWDELDILDYFNKFGSVITQRYHGIVLSEIVNTKILPIYHHDKLKIEGALPYYEISKHRLIEVFNSLEVPNIITAWHAFGTLKEKVGVILNS